MERNILEEYIDACAVIEETEKEIRKLKKKKRMVQDSVRGSNPEFPYQPQSFHIEGTAEQNRDRILLERKEKILEERKRSAEQIRTEVDSWLNTIPQRMQRIIKYKIFEGMTWQQVADQMGRRNTAESVKKEFQRFLEKT